MKSEEKLSNNCNEFHNYICIVTCRIMKIQNDCQKHKIDIRMLSHFEGENGTIKNELMNKCLSAEYRLSFRKDL